MEALEAAHPRSHPRSGRTDGGPEKGPGPGRLPAIPVIEVGAGGPVAVFEAERARAKDLLASGKRCYGHALVRFGDALSRRWLIRTRNPYLEEIAAVAAHPETAGVYFLNLSLEWSCTAGVGADPEAPGSRMLRTLDWPLEGLGRNLVVVRQEGPAGPYLNVTWPGFVGVTTAVAPGRFAAAFNQAPMRRLGLSFTLDVLFNRLGVWRSRALPPAHLMRQVFDQCRTYAEAKARLAETPLCLPALFTLSGVEGHEGCVIERLERRAVLHQAPACITNHWLSPDLKGADRGTNSRERHACMTRLYRTVAGGFDWLVPPILNDLTRLAVVANAADGRLMVQGFEADGPATEILELTA